ncbi:MAG: GNAT family N-acetyltransferase [Pseudobacteriovorax sp.]|nr:GNAT family N-acetyltransferase [Pseudobacteriovorax sp.]
MQTYQIQQHGLTISTDTSLLDFDWTHQSIRNSYWAKGIPRETFDRSLEHSLCFGAYLSKIQVGFARVVTDYATFAYLGDVFIHEEHRGHGYSKTLIEAVMIHPDLQGLRRFCLGTKDAHSLYERFGFKVIKDFDNWMEIKIPDIYQKSGD